MVVFSQLRTNFRFGLLFSTNPSIFVVLSSLAALVVLFEA